TVFVVTCLVNSTYGRGFLATHDDEIASEAVGLNNTRYKIVAFVIGAFFAGIAGGLYGHFKLHTPADGLPLHEKHRDRRDGDSRRHGQHARRHSRRRPADLAPGIAAPDRR